MYDSGVGKELAICNEGPWSNSNKRFREALIFNDLRRQIPGVWRYIRVRHGTFA